MFATSPIADTTSITPVITMSVSGQPKESISEESKESHVVPNSFSVKIPHSSNKPNLYMNNQNNMLIELLKSFQIIINVILIFAIGLVIGPIIIISGLCISNKREIIIKKYFWLMVTITCLSVMFWIIMFETTPLKKMV